MRNIRLYILLLLLAPFWFTAIAQFDPSSISRIENGKLQFTLDNSWSESQKKEVQKLFNLDSTIWIQLKNRNSQIVMDNVNWNVKYISGNIAVISKSLEKLPVSHLNINDIFLIDEHWEVAPGYVDQDKVYFGFNKFRKDNSFSYSKGLATFFLPGYSAAGTVNLSGSFNDWNPSGLRMHKTDSGWISVIALDPGKYLYKFIVDGRWMTDPGNLQNENDGVGNINSVVYCPNVNFFLPGFQKSRRVYLCGTFNNWNKRSLRMTREENGWSLPVYLRDGTYDYKFLADDEWILDPLNSGKRSDGQGNVNSVIGLGDTCIFRLQGFRDAHEVILAGNFNNWNPYELKLSRYKDGWEISYQLARGNYEYKFLVDGKWITDPDNPVTSGTGDYINSILSFKPNYTFSVPAFPNARELRLTGSFINWSRDGYRMQKTKDAWVISLYLSPGKQLYKLIVDGEWLTDPTNDYWEDNEYGTGNSVLWIPKGE